MGNIIKINLYAEHKNIKKSRLDLKMVEEAIQKYSGWLKNTNREDKIESYEEFLRVQ